MTDEEIIALFWARDEDAIRQTDRRYGAYCRSLSRRIVANAEDAEECVNDSYLSLWQRIPPERPPMFLPFLAQIVRNISISRLRRSEAQKRGRALTVALGELRQVAGRDDPESRVAAAELGVEIGRFLRTLPELHRGIFLRRYYFFETRGEIAKRYRIPAASVSVSLSRTRKKLAAHLRKEGWL